MSIKKTIISILLLFWPVACISNDGHDNGGSLEMSDLRLTAKPVKSNFIAGEQLVIRSILTNVDKEPRQVKSLDMLPPISYYVQPLDKKEEARVFSSQAYQTWLMEGNSAPELESPPINLEPGKSMEIDEDLAKYSLSTLLPGRYQLYAQYLADGLNVTSEPVEFSIDIPRIKNFESVECPSWNAVVSIMDHTSSDGVVSLFQKTTYTRFPYNGVFIKYLELPQSSVIDDLAVSLIAGGENEGRWFAWRQGNSLSFAKAWGNSLTSRFDLLETGMSEARLVKAGFELRNFTGLFAVAGKNANGGAVMRQLLASAGGVKKGNIVPLCDKLPERILAQYRPDDAGGRLFLYWAETTNNKTRIFCRSYSTLDWTGDKKPRMLYEREGVLVAFEVAPFSVGEEMPLVHLLFGPEPPEDRDKERPLMRYVRVNPDKGGKADEYYIYVPEASVEKWAISSSDLGPLPIVAKTADKLLWAQMMKGQGWQMLCGNVPDIRDIHILSSLQGEYWVEWISSVLGVRQFEIPCEMVYEPDDDEDDDED